MWSIHGWFTVYNGLTDTECTSLKNDTGFTPSVGHTDCEDLGNANDCLIGNMQEEIKDKEVCDWKDFTSALVGNVHAVLSGIVCAICGLWTKVHYLECMVSHLGGEHSYEFEKNDFILGKGIDFDRTSDAHYQLPVLEIRGTTYKISGSIGITLDGDYENYWGAVGKATVSSAGKGINTDNGNWTLCIVDIEKAKYPEIKKIHQSTGQFTNNGCGQITVDGYDEGKWYPSQWGWDEEQTTANTVPEGHYYVRVCLSNGISWNGNASHIKVTFNSTGLAELDYAEIEC